MFTRKSLFVALTILAMLAMVVPVATAAPEVLHGVKINSVTPKYLNGTMPGHDPAWIIGDKLTVNYTVTIDQMQVDDVWVRATLYDKGHFVHARQFATLANEKLNAGKVTYDISFDPGDPNADPPVPVSNPLVGPQGWYDLEVCAVEADAPPEVYNWCDTKTDAVLLDIGAPKVWLDKPEKGSWVTGDYLMVGGAWDEWGLDETTAVFQYCAISNYWTPADGTRWNCGPDDKSWIDIAKGTKTGAINEYGGTEFAGTWDSTLVPDDEGAIRFCIADLVGNLNCVGHTVWLDNYFKMHLNPGWNLISTPLLLYKSNVEDVLHHLLALNKVEEVLAYDPVAGWTKWTPTGPNSLSTIDHGKGYWVKMVGEGDLNFAGTWKNVGMQSPPEYGVKEGWNLIGYTQWGRPTAFYPTSKVNDYFDGVFGIQALYLYDAGSEVYRAVYASQNMTLGAGYWLATTEDGTVRP